MRYAWLALIACCTLAASPAHAAKDPIPGGIGVYFAPTFIVAGKWHDDATSAGVTETYDQDWKFQAFTPAFGLFAEYQPSKHLAIGLEGYLAFTKVKKARDPDDGLGWLNCVNCKTDTHFALLLRVKIPFRIGRLVGLYPLVGFGFDLYAANREEAAADTTDARFKGIAALVGFGTELYIFSWLTPFAEARYMLGAGWDTLEQAGLKEDVRAITHSLVITLGVRFL
jgi:hypothetical protein